MAVRHVTGQPVLKGGGGGYLLSPVYRGASTSDGYHAKSSLSLFSQRVVPLAEAAAGEQSVGRTATVNHRSWTGSWADA